MKSFLLAAWVLVLRDYRLRFRRTLLGVIWFLVPLFTLVGLALLVGRDVGLYPEGQSKNYLVQLLAGLILWQLMTDTWLEPMRFARRANTLLRSVVFDTRILLAAGAISGLIAFALKLPVLIAASIWFNIALGLFSIWTPLLLCALVFAGVALACFTLPASLALLDVRYAMPFVQYALLLATPIFYSTPDAGPVAWLNRNNPFTHLVIPCRETLLGGSADVFAIMAPAAITLCFLVLGLYYFQSKIHLAIAYIGR